MTTASKSLNLLVNELTGFIGKKIEITATRGKLTGILVEIQGNHLVLKTTLSQVIIMLDQIIFVRTTLPRNEEKTLAQSSPSEKKVSQQKKQQQDKIEPKTSVSNPSSSSDSIPSKPIIKKLLHQPLFKAKSLKPNHPADTLKSIAKRRQDSIRRVAAVTKRHHGNP